MDTIFVRLVRDNSPAHLAGLCQGDRIVSVNGETIGGKSYAQVVQLVQSSGAYLHLLVVPKEEDLLQQYFGETAHNPETNQRPQRMRSPADRQASPLSSRPVSGVSGASDFPSGWPPPPASGPGAAATTASGEPLYDTASASRRSSEGSTQRRELMASARTQFMMGAPAPVAASLVGASAPGAGVPRGLTGLAWESLPAHCRLSLDASGMPMPGLDGGGGGGSLPGTGGVPSADSSRRESSSSLPAAGTAASAGAGTAASSKDSLLSMDSTSTLQDACSGCSSDDSVILSRIRRSTEQKEEFLRRPAQPIWPFMEPQQLAQQAQREQAAPQQKEKGVIAREFYARPQKLQKPVWPPASERDAADAAAEDRDAKGGVATAAGEAPNFVAGGPVGGSLAARANKSYFSTLSRIQENQPPVSSTGSEDTMMNGDSTSLPSSCSSRGAEENQPHLPVIHLVSRRARQFEAGEEEDSTDRTSFYRSELARLSAKKGVPEVAVRKREFESRSLQENSSFKKLEKAGSPPATSSLSSSAVSGNRSIPIGSSKLHCDPPPDYKPSPEDLLYGPEPHTQPSTLKIRIRSRSADPSHYDQRNKAVRQDSYLNAVSSDRKRQAVISTVLEEEREGGDVSPSPAPKILAPDPTCSAPTTLPIRPNQLPIANPLRPASYPQRNSIGDPEGLVQGLKGQPRAIDTSTVVRRQKDTSSIDEDRSTRRVSYLKATWNDRMHVDSDLDLSDTEPTPSVAQRRLNRKWRPPLFPDDIQRLKRLFEDAAAAATGHSISLHQGAVGRVTPLHCFKNISAGRSGATAGSGSSPRGSPRTPSTKDAAAGLGSRDREGWLHCKITFIDGKRATDRSWKQVWATVRGSVLGLYKERPPEVSTQLAPRGRAG
ncbi:Rho GTPase-activating protein 21 [Frankliniella fusca]|uniref:Rho GTPase-activating protein 21 n=1 Tax=Frankliniella fusca TaxID=407009 RepID=A0AAE1GR76_9NEOP|nr:Rho GTPase-activating protein 21 [Frankliniella fusca]